MLLTAQVSLNSHSLSTRAVGFFGQRVNAAGIDPAIVEVEKRANGDGEVNCFVIPPGGAQRCHILGRDLLRFLVHLMDESEQGFVLFIQARCFQIAQNALDQLLAPE